MNDFIDSHCKEYAGSTIDIRINRRDHLRADEHGKMKRDIDVAFVIPKVDDATRPSAPLTFIKTERGWKFTPER